MATRPRTSLVTGLALGCCLAAPADVQARQVSLKLSGAAAAGRQLVCGQERDVLAATEGSRLRGRVGVGRGLPGRVAVILDRCKAGRWQRERRIARATVRRGGGRVARRIASPPAGDYRLRARLRSAGRVATRALFLHVDRAVVTFPVEFAVQNVNRSRLSCSSDGADYRLVGRLTAPLGALRDGAATTLYLHEFSYGKYFWGFPAPGYDFAAELARRGHVSVAVDRLGYDDSSHPVGTATCLGAQADMAHQVVEQLRAGDYTVVGDRPVSFARVALAGHSVGGVAAEIAAYSFGGIDALLLIAHADQNFTPEVVVAGTRQNGVCATGGEESDPGQAGGYAYFGQSEAESRDFGFHSSAEPSIVEATLRMRNRDPCGDAASLASAVAANNLYAGEIAVPVLLAYGTADPVYDQPAAGEGQRSLMSGSSDVTLRFFENTAHAMTLERSAPELQRTVADWLTERGL